MEKQLPEQQMEDKQILPTKKLMMTWQQLKLHLSRQQKGCYV
jgi:hypothetical protein